MTPQDVLDFWLDEVGPKGWYAGGAALDALCRQRFGSALDEAPRLVAEWAGTAPGSLAALILTDQLPRNIFRGQPRAYATDPLARATARAAIAAGHDLATPEPQRQFFYLPLEHSEDLADQDDAVRLFETRTDMPDTLRHARLHRDVIARFGRFPWRNAELGRTSTAEEQALLDSGGYGALVSGRASLPPLAPKV